MRIVMATLACPTWTSELYEHSLSELAALYATKAFHSADAAIEWAQREVEEYNEYLDADDLHYARLEGADEARFEDTVGSEVRYVYWSQEGGPELGVDSGWCLRIWEQTL